MDYIGLFEEYLKKEKKLSANTLESYKRDIVQYDKYCQASYQNILTTYGSSINSYLIYLQKEGKATSTISRSLASMRCFYQFLVRSRIIEKDPTTNLESPKVEKKLPSILSKKEVELLLEQPQPKEPKGCRDKAMLELLYATGIRVSELINFDINDIDLNDCVAVCNIDNDRKRSIPIGNIAIDSLKKYLYEYRVKFNPKSDENALFLNFQGKKNDTPRLLENNKVLHYKSKHRQINYTAHTTPFFCYALNRKWGLIYKRFKKCLVIQIYPLHKCIVE